MMNKTLQNFFAFGTNWLRRLGCNKLAFWLSEKLYNSIDIDKIFGEVYADCYDIMAKRMPSIDQNWGWMQQEHIRYLFGGLTISEMHPESAALTREFETLLPKKHPVAMATMEAFKADSRDAQIKSLLKEIMRRLQLPTVDVTVLFSNDKTQTTVHPKYKEVHYSKKIDTTEEKSKEVADLARLAVAGTAVDWMTKMMEQKENMVQATFVPVTGHRNESFVPVRFGVWNIGDSAIESCTLFFTFPECVELKRSNVERTMFPEILDPKSSTWVVEEEHKIRFDVGNITLGLGKKSKDVYIRIPHDVDEIEVQWSLSCKTAKRYGILTIKNEPELIPEYEVIENMLEENPRIEDMVVTLTD